MIRRLILLLLLRHYHAEISRGTVIVPPHGTTFLSKFCLDTTESEDGCAANIEVSLWPNVTKWPEGAHLVTFDDQASSYPRESAAWDKMTCQEKLDHVRSQWEFDETEDSFYQSTCVHEKVRARFWYWAILDCSGTPMEIKFESHFTNDLRGWQKEFSMDQLWTLRWSIAFLLAEIGIAYLHHSSADSRCATHPMTKLLTASVWTSILALSLSTVVYLIIARTGERQWFLYASSRFMFWASKFLVMSLLMLLARGRGVSWNMSRGDLIWLAKMLCPLVFWCYGLEMWAELAQSRLYNSGFIYDTYNGCALILVDLGLLAIFAKELRATHHEEVDRVKRLFYVVLGVLALAWFLVLPIMALLGLIIAPWVRSEVFSAINRLAVALGTLSLVMFFRQTADQYVISGDGFVGAKTFGQGILKLKTGPLPSEPEEMKASELELLSADN